MFFSCFYGLLNGFPGAFTFLNVLFRGFHSFVNGSLTVCIAFSGFFQERDINNADDVLFLLSSLILIPCAMRKPS